MLILTTIGFLVYNSILKVMTSSGLAIFSQSQWEW